MNLYNRLIRFTYTFIIVITTIINSISLSNAQNNDIYLVSKPTIKTKKSDYEVKQIKAIVKNKETLIPDVDVSLSQSPDNLVKIISPTEGSSIKTDSKGEVVFLIQTSQVTQSGKLTLTVKETKEANAAVSKGLKPEIYIQPEESATPKIDLLSPPVLKITDSDREKKIVRLLVMRGQEPVEGASIKVTDTLQNKLIVSSTETIVTNSAGEATVELLSTGEITEGKITFKLESINGTPITNKSIVVLKIEKSLKIDITSIITAFVGFLLLMTLLSIGVEKFTDLIKLTIIKSDGTIPIFKAKRPDFSLNELLKRINDDGTKSKLGIFSLTTDEINSVYNVIVTSKKIGFETAKIKQINNETDPAVKIQLKRSYIEHAIKISAPLILQEIKNALTIKETKKLSAEEIQKDRLKFDAIFKTFKDKHTDDENVKKIEAEKNLSAKKTLEFSLLQQILANDSDIDINQIITTEITREIPLEELTEDGVNNIYDKIKSEESEKIILIETTPDLKLSYISENISENEKQNALWTGSWRFISLIVSVIIVLFTCNRLNAFILLEPVLNAMNIKAYDSGPLWVTILGNFLTAFGAAAGSQFWHDFLDSIVKFRNSITSSTVGGAG